MDNDDKWMSSFQHSALIFIGQYAFKDCQNSTISQKLSSNITQHLNCTNMGYKFIYNYFLVFFISDFIMCTDR